MPAYFTISFEIKKENKYDNLYKDFIQILQNVGFVFKSGYWESEEDTLDEIIKWNTEKLKEDFELGYTEHFSKDYKQICWEYNDFSEVRSYILNCKYDDFFKMDVIIPEREIIEFKGQRIIYDSTIKEKLIRLACRIWKCDFIDNIQTSLELSEGVTSHNELKKGIMPSVEPFAIIQQDLYDRMNDGIYETLVVERNGILLSLEN